LTVIAWDGKTLAADRQATSNGLIRAVTKIWRRGDGAIAGAAGGLAQSLIVREWWQAGEDLSAYPDTQRDEDWAGLFVAHPILGCWHYEQRAARIPVEDRIFAMGNGGDLALGAMAAGACAEQAVAVAIQWSADCGAGIDLLSLQL